MNNSNPNTEINFLISLCKREIEKIAKMPQPVVRVCGPLLSDGPDGYARNARRLSDAEKILKSQGMTVWTFEESESEIYNKGFAHKNILKYFHEPILASGLIKEAYFLPRWERSTGATEERKIAESANVVIREFPEEWFG